MKKIIKTNLADFQDASLNDSQLKNLVGGLCRRTSYIVRSTGKTGTDSWCDNNGDGKVQGSEITYRLMPSSPCVPMPPDTYNDSIITPMEEIPDVCAY